jgi:hypothetical protein
MMHQWKGNMIELIRRVREIEYQNYKKWIENLIIVAKEELE